MREVVNAAGGKPILYFPARHDHYRVQTGDGYAAHIAGAIGVSTDAQASWWGGQRPRHRAARADRGLRRRHGARGRGVRAHADGDMNIVVLVDYDNDSVRTALAVAEALGPRLWGVRLDTSNTMVDRSLWPQMGRFDPRGVNPQLVWNVRNALDAAGHGAVKIVVSGGFTSEKIRAFEAAGVPVDSYGVGSALIRGENDFTADVVLVDGEERGKAGRAHAPTDRVERVR